MPALAGNTSAPWPTDAPHPAGPAGGTSVPPLGAMSLSTIGLFLLASAGTPADPGCGLGENVVLVPWP